ncbi:MAG: glutathione S-transferase domain-containing protein, partial [Dehalococcoidia bacterium]
GRADMRVWTRRLDENIHMPATATLSFAIALRETYLKAFDSREALEAHIASKPNPLNRAMHLQIAELGIEAPVVRQSLELFDKLLARMEAALALKPWLDGETFSLADVGYSPYITRLDCLQLDWLWSDRPHVADWYSRLKSRPTYKQAITDWLVTKEIDLMRENGRKFRKTLQHMLSE